MTVDISDTLAPTSDQLDAVELVGGPRTFTIESVSRGSTEQPVNIHLAEFPRPWRPGKSMRRVLAACWGTDASAYVGRRVTLYCDNEVAYGGKAVGGTRIAAMSHLDKPKQIPLLVTRGKSAIFTVQPLADEPAPKPDPSKALFAALQNAGLTSKESALAYLSDLLQRAVTSTKELTADEVTRAVDDLSYGSAHVGATEPTPPEATS